MQAKNSKSYDAIRAAIENGIRAINSQLPYEATDMLDVLQAKENDMLEEINHALRDNQSVNLELLNIRLNQYKEFLMNQAEIWKNDEELNSDRKSLIEPFLKHVNQQAEILQNELAAYQEPSTVSTVAPVAMVSTVEPQPLVTAPSFIDQLKNCINRTGTVIPDTSKTPCQSALVKYDATTNIKDITVSRSESGQISTSTDNPNRHTLIEMLSILESMEPKGKKALKIDAQDEQTLRVLYGTAKSLGHTVDLTNAQKQTLGVTEALEPPAPKQ